jgi:hypothetical protein
LRNDDRLVWSEWTLFKTVCILFYKILLSVLLTNFIIRCCDNGPEFKASVAKLAQQLGIHMIRGRPYHPQTQGSVEVANKTFKRRLRALQLAKGTSNWVELLPELARTINTTTSSALPRRKTPFEVWFGRKPHWVARIGHYNDNDNDSDFDNDDDNDLDSSQDLVLTEIEA